MDLFGKGKGLSSVKDDEEAPPSSPDDLEENEETSAAQDVLDAIKADDAEMLSMALERHYEACKGKSEESETKEY